MNVHYQSRVWLEKVLSNLAQTPFRITLDGGDFECNSVEGFWQGLKCEGDLRKCVFLMSGFEAKKAVARRIDIPLRLPTVRIALAAGNTKR